MRQITYTGLRRLPSAGAGLGVFVISTWAALDAESLKQWFATRDLATTGALVAILIALYVLALWITRGWNTTDRDFYREQLHTIYTDVSAHLRNALSVTTDEQLEAACTSYESLWRNARDWIRPAMGDAAWGKFEAARGGSYSYTWDGQHSPDAIEKRNRLIDHLKDHQKNLDEMMGKATWDHPIPLRKREWAERRQKWKEKAKRVATWPKRALTPS